MTNTFVGESAICATFALCIQYGQRNLSLIERFNKAISTVFCTGNSHVRDERADPATDQLPGGPTRDHTDEMTALPCYLSVSSRITTTIYASV